MNRMSFGHCGNDARNRALAGLDHQSWYTSSPANDT
jgi:hypothetical protein